MLTQNCDSHKLLGLMHRPGKDKEGNVLPSDKQDKRAVVPIERANWERWLNAPVEEAQKLIGLPGMECIEHGAADPTKEIALPL